VKLVETEVCVLGGGPAGATVARRLAELGHEVTLVEKSVFPRRRIGECLPPSILPVLEALGLRVTIEKAGFLRPAGSIIRWSSEHELLKPYGAERGFHVDRGRFDALLLDMAIRRGVKVLQPMRAGTPRRLASSWLVPVGGSGGRLTIRARALVDASGRRARRRGPVRTLAIWGYWRGVPQQNGNEPRIEAAADAWYWGAPLPDSSFNAAVFVDARAGVAKRYREYLARSELLRHCLNGAFDGGVHACDATPYFDDNPIGADHLRVGEASYATDPLSSQGVQHALGSALQGSIALHTVLTDPANNDAAINFYRSRQAAAAAASAGTCAQLYAQVGCFGSAPFWKTRARAAAALAGIGSVGTPIEAASGALPEDRPLRLADGLRVSDTPVLVGNQVRCIPALHHPALNRPTAFLGDIALTPLVGQMREGDTAGELSRRWPLSPRDSRRILNWLWHRGLLQER
jgi:flavin-dependent dehydrogenase